MTALLTSVQTAQDSSVPPSLVLAGVLSLVLLVVAVSAVEIAQKWREANRVIRHAETIAAGHDPRTCDCEAVR